MDPSVPSTSGGDSSQKRKRRSVPVPSTSTSAKKGRPNFPYTSSESRHYMKAISDEEFSTAVVPSPPPPQEEAVEEEEEGGQRDKQEDEEVVEEVFPALVPSPTPSFTSKTANNTTLAFATFPNNNPPHTTTSPCPLTIYSR